MAIATRSAVKQMLEINITEDDALLDQLLVAADAFLMDYCGRDFAGGTFTEYHESGTRTIFLANYPVTAVESLYVDATGNFGSETLLSAERYSVAADRGVIVSREGPFGGTAVVPRAVKVIYTTATNTVPAAVSRAYAELIGHWYRQAKTADHLGHLNVTSRNESGIETRYSLAGATQRIPGSTLALLAPYRVPVV